MWQRTAVPLAVGFFLSFFGGFFGGCTPSPSALHMPKERFSFQALVDASSGSGQVVRWAGLEVREPSGARQVVETRGEDTALLLADGTHTLRYVVTTLTAGATLPASPRACENVGAAVAVRPHEGLKFFSREQSFTLSGSNTLEVALPAASTATKTVVVRISAASLSPFPALAGFGLGAFSTRWGQRLPAPVVCAPQPAARLLAFEIPLVAEGGDPLVLPSLLWETAVDTSGVLALVKASTYIDLGASGPRDASLEDFDGDGIANEKEDVVSALGGKPVAPTPKPATTATAAATATPASNTVRGNVVCTPEHVVGKPGESYGIGCSGAYDILSGPVRYESESTFGACAPLLANGTLNTTFAGVNNCRYRARACDSSGTCTPWSPEYKVSSYTATATLQAPTLNPSCTLSFSTTTALSPNVSAPEFAGGFGFGGVTPVASSGLLSGVLDFSVPQGTFEATYGLERGDLGGSVALSSVFSPTATVSYALQTVVPTALSPAGEGYMDGMQLSNISTAANGCVATENAQFAQVAMGDAHTCGVTKTGALKCWGENGAGQVGDGTTVNRLEPTDVPGLGAGVKAVALGQSFTCALTHSGAVKCWGEGSFGQLGNGGSSSQVPVDVSGLGTGVKALAAGTDFACALLADSSVACWGQGDSGQLGNGGNAMSNSPVAVAGLGTSVKQISAGSEHVCAVANNGTAKCWGGNFSGELGDGTTVLRSSPVEVPGLAGVVQVAAGLDHSCALLATGDAHCWGNNGGGQLGRGDTTNSVVPVAVTSPGGASAAISAGDSRTCALLTSGGVECWGYAYRGALGNQSQVDASTPQSVLGLGGPAVSISTQGENSCALMASGATKCWGPNDFGEQGDGRTQHSLAPNPVSLVSSEPALSVASGAGSMGLVCAVTNSNAVQCWGGGKFTAEVFTGLSGVTKLGLGGGHGCAVASSGTVSCWGSNNNGQLGDGTTTNRSAPVAVLGLTGVADVSLGAGHSCALTQTGGVKCWGNNFSGQLGDGTTTNRSAPVDVPGLAGVSALAAGASHTCALLVSGSVKCWGANSQGQLGDGTTTNSLAPVDVSGLAGVSALAEGNHHTCALMGNGAVKCWGYNADGQLGDNTRTSRSTAADVFGGAAFGASQLSAGLSHTCAVLASGAVHCWGSNAQGQLGDTHYFVNKNTPIGFSNVSRQAKEIRVLP